MQIIIKRFGVTPEELQQEIDFKFITIKNGIKSLGFATQDYMRKVIADNTKRPGSTGNLANSIKCEVADVKGETVGVGKISELAVYWAAINFGSNHIMNLRLPPGTFQPGVPRPTSQDFRRGRWQVGQYGSLGGSLYSPLITKPIQPMNYVEKTANWLSTVIKIQFFNWTKEVKVFTR